ncbi:hypothetical protein A1F94_007390 [Pyrenophora tritici-repentis]|uniref:Uncharacterized protein n=1 Tax=Pyrenophora tritici-repentis (strain Pt-1C-BFP) TaxID=426418 RepID=B2WD62_PYRTR|nr:uncharacterized protein PTRG_07921 [Pyrenophora tritici-repentis Pt-1C-BFP]KAA8616735.1 hypothetical protein PtrV1_10036 [Pyrenophora tritici-repentis]EDU50840.1 conserved hypothetical protein [Pyrenophora tritici-repentis Pt-1C-BFP]KAG9381736.1 hypothetical protein A1F94_007390 [Pyrenophora tritici-repentis]KAI1590679.1 hypothetical protein PtrEW13061_005227 [Pyrenophora tritici-repentis]PWO28621.1 cyclin [Pyrenophora tritici-repentis]
MADSDSWILSRDFIFAGIGFDKKRKGLKRMNEFDSNYWKHASEMASYAKQRTESGLQILANTCIADEICTLRKSPCEHNVATFLMEEDARVWEIKARIYKHRATDFEPAQNTPFAYPTLGINNTAIMAERRDPKLMSEFRGKITDHYNMQCPTSNNCIWDIVSNRYIGGCYLETTQLFSRKYNQTTMTAIFGPKASEDLFSALNGLLMGITCEDAFEGGILAIVPDIDDPTSKIEVVLWQSQSFREYKVRIFDNGQPDMCDIPFDIYCNGDEDIILSVELRDLNDWKLKFPTPSRPAERYLFFRYCCHILRRVWHITNYNTATPKAQLGTWLWGATGKYVPRDQM